MPLKKIKLRHRLLKDIDKAMRQAKESGVKDPKRVLTEIRDYFRLKLGKWAIFKNAG